MGKNIPVLYYHFISHPSKTTRIKGLYTSARQFEWQIKRLIKAGFQFITFEDLALGNYQSEKRNIILTFDDGCESLYINAFPVLKKYGIKGVIYIVTAYSGAKNVVWEDNENKDPLNLLTEDQITEMAAYGIEFGSHLTDHLHLTKLTEGEIRNQLSESKKYIESLLDKNVYSVAYPFGSYNEQVVNIAEETGYQFGVTTISGNNLNQHNLELYRYSVKGYAFRHYWYFYKMLKTILKSII
jgi:peptidoglycan/xylan/chitin deacetylase (PgdA/CDA1 family)